LGSSSVTDAAKARPAGTIEAESVAFRCLGQPGIKKRPALGAIAITLDVKHAARYYSQVIVSYKCAETKALSKGLRVKRFGSIESVARRKLRQLQIAGRLEDLRVPPGNRLEALKGDRAGQHSIRVNDQFRVCFRWTAGGAEDVEIVDYH
jgi:proteic killer suppression protein